MADKDIALMAHFLRRAGFGASRDEIEARVAQGYDKVVEEYCTHHCSNAGRLGIGDVE